MDNVALHSIVTTGLCAVRASTTLLSRGHLSCLQFELDCLISFHCLDGELWVSCWILGKNSSSKEC